MIQALTADSMICLLTKQRRQIHHLSLNYINLGTTRENDWIRETASVEFERLSGKPGAGVAEV